MIALPDLPLSPIELDRLRFGLRRSVPSEGLGAHLRRKQGQSLEFREHRAYQYGDDIRKVDWRASARTGRNGPQIIRTFEAEERLAVAVVLDVRPAMRLPNAGPKLLFALWLAIAICELVAREKDDVIFSTVFGPEDERPRIWRKGAAAARMREAARSIWSSPGGPLADLADARTEPLCKLLRPASAVVLISDMLFEDRTGAMDRFARSAQMQRRELVVAEIDSLGFETALALAPGRTRRLATVEGRQFGEDPVAFNESLFAEAADRIAQLRAKRRSAWYQGGLNWQGPVVWPDPRAGRGPANPGSLDPAHAAEEFRRLFPSLPMLRTLLTQGAAR